MASKRYQVTEKRIAKCIKEGRGSGQGASYQPWLTIHDTSSYGLSSRPPGVTTGRIHHLLSNNEAAVFYQAEWSPAVVDIREQYPIPRSETRRIASEMGVIHPRDHGVDIVMTTDLLLDVRGHDDWLSFALPHGQGRRLLAIACKPDDVFGDARALDKLEIERRYWTDRGVMWTLLTARQLCRARMLKLQWLMEWFWLDHMAKERVAAFLAGCQTVLAHLAVASASTAGAFLSGLDNTYGWIRGTALSMVRHLAAHKRVIMDTDAPFDAWGPLSQIRLPVAVAAAAEAA